MDYNSIPKTEHSYFTILVKGIAQTIGLSWYTLPYIATLFNVPNLENIPKVFLSILRFHIYETFMKSNRQCLLGQTIFLFDFSLIYVDH